MKLVDLDKYFKSILNIEELEGKDPSMNGIQVSAQAGNEFDIEITRIAFAVDACLETFMRAAERKANMVFVHHGLFWGRPIRIDGIHLRRLKCLFDNNIVLYAAHLPLDMHPEFGNNAGICSALQLKDLKPFGDFRGYKIGFLGEFDQPLEIDQVLEKLGLRESQTMAILPFGSKKIKTAAVISGGGTDDVYEAIKADADLYITGDASHQVYHSCLENKINMISCGHYNTETWGVQLLAKKVREELGIETFFVDLPTGL